MTVIINDGVQAFGEGWVFATRVRHWMLQMSGVQHASIGTVPSPYIDGVVAVGDDIRMIDLDLLGVTG